MKKKKTTTVETSLIFSHNDLYISFSAPFFRRSVGKGICTFQKSKNIQPRPLLPTNNGVTGHWKITTLKAS